MAMEAEETLEAKAALFQKHLDSVGKKQANNVHAALLEIQLQLKAPKDNVNNFAHFNYRTAGQILERVKPYLEQTGCTLTIDDEMVMLGERYYVHCTATLHHIASNTEVKNNGWAREALTEKGKMEPQMTGGASTFAKKYALGNLFAIDDSADDPDIGNTEMQGLERVNSAIVALANAKTPDDVNMAKNYYADVMSHPDVQAAGIAAKKRIGY